MGMQNENVRMQDWDFINASYTSGNATNLAPENKVILQLY